MCGGKSEQTRAPRHHTKHILTNICCFSLTTAPQLQRQSHENLPRGKTVCLHAQSDVEENILVSTWKFPLDLDLALQHMQEIGTEILK